jgi:hypothetical protein
MQSDRQIAEMQAQMQQETELRKATMEIEAKMAIEQMKMSAMKEAENATV